MPELHLYPAALTPGNPDEVDGTINRILGTVFYSDVDTYVVALEWFTPLTLPAFCSLSLWSLTGDVPSAETGTRRDLATFNVANLTAGAWNRIDLPTPRFIAANTPAYVQVHTDDHYPFTTPGTFPFTSDDGSLHAYSGVSAGNGRWTNSGDNSVIAGNNIGSGDGYNFFVGVVTNTTPLVEIAATLDITLPATAFDGEGGSDANATLTVVLPPLDMIGEAGAEASGAIDLVLPDWDSELQAQAPAAAALELNLPVPGVTGEADTPAAAVLDVALPSPLIAGEGIAAASGVLGLTLPSPLIAAEGDTDVSAALDITLPVPAVAGEAVRENTATLDIVLPVAGLGMTAGLAGAATLAITLPTISLGLTSPEPEPEPSPSTTPDIAGDGTETVTVLRPRGRDRFGDPLPGSDIEHDEPGCMFAPGPSQEPGFAANMVDTDGAIYAPPGADFLATDKVRIRGDVYSVVGKPQIWGTAGVVVPVRLVTG